LAATDYANHCQVTAKKRKMADDSAAVLNELCIELTTKLNIVLSSEIEPLIEVISKLDEKSTRLKELVAKKKEEIEQLEAEKTQVVSTKEQLEVQKNQAVSTVEQMKALIASAKRIHVVPLSNGGKSYTFSLFPSLPFILVLTT